MSADVPDRSGGGMALFANTGFLFTDLPFAQRIEAAAAAGFDGVEFHDELQREDAPAVAALLARLGLRMGGINAHMGETAGRAALPGQEAGFMADLAAAHAAAACVGAPAIHVLAGKGATDAATYRANLRRAIDATDRLILIEPLCPQAMPGYHLSRLADALELAEAIGPRLRVMFDWFHVATELGAPAAAKALLRHRPLIGHVQAASVPARAEPAPEILRRFRDAGCPAVGLEYRPTQPPAAHLYSLRAALAEG
ncbi:TIM barrel protein [Paracoccus aminovorans]|uniref:TIM barrel protein n=1 Tax=Paracoccus aminovorans TaxID=34004 RepID=UPI000A6D0A19|nr:TIM barrel protein [Paracoccus aminovorans]MDQ7775445.1 TIM barrel protein [Paracoccus aminovorans]